MFLFVYSINLELLFVHYSESKCASRVKLYSVIEAHATLDIILRTHLIDSIWKLCARSLCCWWCFLKLKDSQARKRKEIRKYWATSAIKICQMFLLKGKNVRKACGCLLLDCLINQSYCQFEQKHSNRTFSSYVGWWRKERNETRKKKDCWWIQFYRESFGTDHKPTRILSNAKGSFLCISISYTVSPSTFGRWNLTEPRVLIAGTMHVHRERE